MFTERGKATESCCFDLAYCHTPGPGLGAVCDPKTQNLLSRIFESCWWQCEWWVKQEELVHLRLVTSNASQTPPCSLCPSLGLQWFRHFLSVHCSKESFSGSLFFFLHLSIVLLSSPHLSPQISRPFLLFPAAPGLNTNVCYINRKKIELKESLPNL